VKTPGNVITLATNAAGGPGATLATLDTTALLNGAYVIDVSGTDDHGNQQDNETLVAVAGDYKPGRVVVDVTDFTTPLAGIPITIGRHYDTLNKDKVQDFGFGWSLAISHPDLEVDQANDVTITLPNGRRSTFIFELLPAAVGPVVLGFIATPLFVPEPGVFGTLTADGCSTLVFDPTSANIDPICFDSIFDPTQTHYAPTTYRYTDAYGTVYTMGADGTLKTIQDRNNSILTFASDGITSNFSDRVVSFTRDGAGRITQILAPNQGDFFNTRAPFGYSYDANGNLSVVEHPDFSVFEVADKYGYDGAHRLTSTTDTGGQTIRTSTYDDAGRLATDKDGLGNITQYVYDVPGHTTTTTYPDTGVTTQTFDANGMLLSFVDQLGRTTKHEYDTNRNETKRTNALNEVTTYTYDANGNQTSSTKTALNETTTTTYNAFSEPLTTTNPIGNTTTITYDATGLPTTFVDSMGPLAAFTSSEHGLPETVTDVAGNTVFLGYDGSGDLTSRTDRLGRVTTYGYDGAGLKKTMTDPRGGTTNYIYDYDLRPAGYHGPLGFGPLELFNQSGTVQSTRIDGSSQQVVFLYDADDHVKETDNTDGTFTTQTADFRGNLLTKTDELGRVTRYEYDLAGQLSKTTYPDLTFTKQTFDDLGRLSTKTDGRSNTVTYGYEPGCDCGDRLTSITDALGRTTSMTYDGMSRKTSMTDANNHTTSYIYDLRGHLTETDYADGTSTIDIYDTLGRWTASKDQMGKITQYGYDAEGQLTSVTDPLSHVTQYGYDDNGNLTSVTDANNHVTTYGYDAANRKTSRTLPLGMKEQFGYDADGNVITHTDFRGKLTTYTFDNRYPNGRPTGKVPDPTLGEPSVGYTYYSNGPRFTMTDASGVTTYTYDLRNRLQAKATPEGTLTYTYDASGNVASIDSSNTNGTSVAYAWDAADQLRTVTDNRLGGMTTAAHTATGRPFTLSQPNGVGVTYTYDSLDRVTSMLWQKGTNPGFASFGYGYNLRGQRASSTDVTGREAAYGYDDASRLTSEIITGDLSGPSANGALTYAIDPVGNRSSRTSTLAALGPQSSSYDPNDELTTDGYDLDGNTTSSGGHMYGYDFENRLTSKDGGEVTLVYDGDGNRVAKTAGGVTTQYLVDELNPTGYLQVLDEVSGGAVQVRYAVGDMLVSQTRSPNSLPATSFYGYDANGNVSFLTDTTGAMTDSYDYDAWGNVVMANGSTQNTRLYAGEELDPDLGLLNLRARQYNPNTGRFMTSDLADGQAARPITYQRYLYGSADPVDRHDPLGRADVAEYAIGLAVAALLVATYETMQIGSTHVAAGSLSGVGIGTFCNFDSAVEQIIMNGAGMWLPTLCAIRVPPKTQPLPSSRTYDGIPQEVLNECGNEPPNPFREPPLPCPEQADAVLDDCMAQFHDLGYCGPQRDLALAECEEKEEEIHREMMAAWCRWASCVGAWGQRGFTYVYPECDLE